MTCMKRINKADRVEKSVDYEKTNKRDREFIADERDNK